MLGQPPIIDKLKSAGITTEAFGDAQVLCLPENFLHIAKGGELLESMDLLGFSKRLKSEGLRVFTFFDAGIDLPALERRSGEKWFGTVWIRDIVVMPIVTGVISAAIYTAFEKAASPKETHSAPPIVHIELVIGSGESHTNIKYDGDGPTLVKVLQVLKDEHPVSQSNNVDNK